MALGLLAGGASLASAEDFSWNTSSTNQGWSVEGNWTPAGGPPDSADNVITPTLFGTLALNIDNPTVTNWTYNSANSWQVIELHSDDVNLDVTGTFTKQGTGTLTFRRLDLFLDFNNVVVEGGELHIGQRAQTSSNYVTEFTAGDVSVSGTTGPGTEAGELAFWIENTNGNTATITGNLDLSEGGAVLLRNHNDENGILEVGSLTSTDTTPTVAVNDYSTASATATLSLQNASGTATYAGILSDRFNSTSSNNDSALSVEKNGAGTQEFSGTSNDYTGTTTVNGGTLLISGTHTQNTQFGVGGDYLVNAGGTLAGTNGETFGAGIGNINTSADAGITLFSGGMLSMGAAPDTVGIFSANLGAGVMDISGAVSGANTGSLLFDLAAIGASDQFQLFDGSLAIGNGELEFADFDFTALAGIQEGDYTLFDTTENINGTLGTQLTGIFGSVWEGTLSIQNDQDVVLSVALIPEPTSTALLIGATGLLALRRRRR